MHRTFRFVHRRFNKIICSNKIWLAKNASNFNFVWRLFDWKCNEIYADFGIAAIEMIQFSHTLDYSMNFVVITAPFCWFIEKKTFCAPVWFDYLLRGIVIRTFEYILTGKSQSSPDSNLFIVQMFQVYSNSWKSMKFFKNVLMHLMSFDNKQRKLNRIIVKFVFYILIHLFVVIQRKLCVSQFSNN